MSKRKIATALVGMSAVGILSNVTTTANATEIDSLNEKSKAWINSYNSQGTVSMNRVTRDIHEKNQPAIISHFDHSDSVGKYIVDTGAGGERMNFTGLVLDNTFSAFWAKYAEGGYIQKNGKYLAENYNKMWITANGYKYFICNVYGDAMDLASGFTRIDNKLYYFKEDRLSGSNSDWVNPETYGTLYTTSGWVNNLGGITGRYYVYSDGEVATGERTIGGVRYLFNSSGILQNKTITLNVPSGNVTIDEGQAYDVMTGVTSSDTAGANANSKVTTKLNGFDPKNPKAGTYTIEYTLSEGGQTKKATRKIIVKGTPTLSGLEDVIIEAGTEFNPLTGVTATNPSGEEIELTTDNVTYSEGFNPKAPKVGAYTATYKIDASNEYLGKTATRNITVVKRNNNGPTISGVDEITIAKGVDFEPLNGVTVTDKEDSSENIKLTVTQPENFDINTEGRYVFTYRAEDLDGNVTEVPRVVNVKEMVDSNFVRGSWVGSSLVFEGKFDILGTTTDASVAKKLVIKDTSGEVISETDVENLATDNNTGYRKLIDDSIFTTLKTGQTYNMFIKTTVGGKVYEEPITQNVAARNSYVTNVNELPEKEFEDYKIRFTTNTSNNQVQIVKAHLRDVEKPVITANNISVVRGDSSFNLKNGVTITDNVDSQEDLLGRLEINEGNFDINQAGTYEVTYTVRDAAGNVSETVTRTVTVTPKTTTPPTIKGASDVSIVQGTAFDERNGVTAESAEKESLTDRIQVDGTVDESQVGEQFVTYTVTDRDNNTTTVTRKVTVTAKPVENKLPTINAPMLHEIYVGDNFDPLAIATAEDPEDGPIELTSKNIVFNKVNNQKPGEYQVKYEVTDTAGARRSKVITVVVKQRPATSVKPTITFPEKTVIQVGESFNPIKDVTATDYKGNPITVEMKHVSWNKVDTSKPGDYQVKYTVSDSEGNTKIAYRTVTVEGQAVTSKKPTIEYASNVVQTGTVFDPLAGVTAKDYKGQIINLTMSNVSWNKVDTNTPGTYQVKYTVVDSEGNRQIFYRDVTVQGSTVTPPSTDKKPVISFQDNIEISVGDVFNPLDGVTATDYKGQDIALNESNIAWNKVDTTKAGTYQVKYVVRDSEGNQKIAYRTVIVKGYTGLRGTASLQSVTIDKNTNTLRVIGNVDSLIHVVNDKESNVATIDSDVKYYLVAKDANGNEIFKNYMVRMNNGGSNSGFKVNNLSNEELNKIQEGNDVTLSIVVETLGTKGELTLNAGSLSAPVELVDTARNVKYTTYSEGNKVKISKSQNTVTLSEAEKVEVEAIEEAPKSEEVIEANTIAEEVVIEENTAVEEVVIEENTAVEEVVIEENTAVEEAIEEINLEVISDEEILELESELLLEGDIIIE